MLQSKVHLKGNMYRQVAGAGVVGMARRWGQYANEVRITEVKGWPLRGRCYYTRAAWLTIASIMFFGGLTSFVGSLVVGSLTDGTDMLAVVAMGGFLLMPLAAFPFALGGIPRLIGARTSSGGTNVLIYNPSTAFLTELRSIKRRAKPNRNPKPATGLRPTAHKAILTAAPSTSQVRASTG